MSFDTQLNGFGNFAVVDRSNGAANREDPLVFYISGVSGDSIASYVAPSSGNAAEGNAYFAASIAGFNIDGVSATSGFFGAGNGVGTPPTVSNPPSVPLPGAVWMFGAGLFGLLRSGYRRSLAA